MIAGGIFVLSGLAVATVGAAAAVSFGLAAIVASNLALLASLELPSLTLGVLATAVGVLVWFAVLD